MIPCTVLDCNAATVLHATLLLASELDGRQWWCCADTLVENLTVREMLAYTAELKLELEFGAAGKKQRVDLLIEALALEPCQHVRIGSALQRGISGASGACMLCTCIVHMVRKSFEAAMPGSAQGLFLSAAKLHAIWKSSPCAVSCMPVDADVLHLTQPLRAILCVTCTGLD